MEFQRGAPADYFWECSIFKGVGVGHIDGFNEMAQTAAFPCVLAGSCSRSEKEQEMKYLTLKEMSSLITKFFLIERKFQGLYTWKKGGLSFIVTPLGFIYPR